MRVSSVGVSSVSEVSGVSDVSDRRTCVPGTAGPVSWDRWTCVLGPQDLCPGTAGPVSWDRWTCVLGPLVLGLQATVPTVPTPDSTAYFEHLSNTSSCQSNSHPYPGNPGLTLDVCP